MSLAYQAVGWNRHKKIYDAVVLGGSLGFLAVFAAVTLATQPNVTPETLLIRSTGSLALVLLHLVLVTGPLARLDPRFLPLLYNRRHLGVTLGLVALVHGTATVVQFHTQGDLNPLVSVLTGDGSYDSLGRFPFQPWGLGALVILLLMTATSHDFWLANLTPPVWKSLHMLVYVAYGLLLAHVSFGVLQDETSIGYPLLVGAGFVLVVALHLAAALKERHLDHNHTPPAGDGGDGFVDVCAVADIPEARAHVTCISGERVAVFRYGDRISAVSNVCQHQNGPLGEGRIIDGCITCPWHGFQYRPDTGRAPEPFTDRIPTFDVRIVAGRVQVGARPHPPGTRVEPAMIGPETA